MTEPTARRKVGLAPRTLRPGREDGGHSVEEIPNTHTSAMAVRRAGNVFRDARARLTEVSRHRPLTAIEQAVLDKARVFLATEE